ncbi:hepcidin-2-like [Malaclemys terrapin pileata]|uniref:hepcidin-2-like n=1 Tax=Malaclemys terrapin pileata TaxID=2991368 RepID=UPI0023A8886F|nr:hepcidin-2-like [Malaclemys terrapin pileata]
MRVQMLAVLLLFVSLLCAEGIHGASLAGGSDSQHSEEGLGESKVMVKREAAQSFAACRFCCNCCRMSGCGFCCDF